ncbi:uncharacterized protein BJ212DRAFT_1487668 [Suillus subaureus]|uniref:Uncharacterized protein n=1 Tax=Suillus subaureus TaxID=48587 RepID=A0A9P7J3R6_9AGAM|nr:uncharacterized protein BJ212DRAFT_1487668 [Suillus subaureus]KAG1801283.1 hypothetical protein BJ212DRAFT_1487668 [Suillus subaureus]
MGLMEVHCSPAKQHQFMESLIAYMGSDMPIHLCYAARIVREEIVLIDAIDINLQDMVLTKLSPTILTTLFVTPFDTITEQQWWDMMIMAWCHAEFVIDDIHCFEFLPILVEGMKRYMWFALEDDLKQLVSVVGGILRALERHDSEQGEGVVVTVKEFRTVASNMLGKLVNSKGVISP